MLVVLNNFKPNSYRRNTSNYTTSTAVTLTTNSTRTHITYCVRFSDVNTAAISLFQTIQRSIFICTVLVNLKQPNPLIV